MRALAAFIAPEFGKEEKSSKEAKSGMQR
jgi:hypothetical protein